MIDAIDAGSAQWVRSVNREGSPAIKMIRPEAGSNEPPRCEPSLVGARLAAWQQALVAKIQSLRSLPENWDAQGAAAVDSGVIYFAESTLRNALVSVPNAVAPFLVPLADGGVQAEWHRAGADLEIAFWASGEITALFEDRKLGVELEAEGDAAIDLLLRRARRVAEGHRNAHDEIAASHGPQQSVAA